MRRLDRVIDAGGFPREPIPHGDRSVQAYVVRCACCPTVEHNHIASTDPRYNAPDQIAKRFKRTGWTIGRDRSDDMCPTCSGVGRSKAKEEPVSPQAEKTHPQHAPTVAKPHAPINDDQARLLNMKPTREERRRIMAELHAHYNPGAGRYSGQVNDSSLAVGLKLPKAWIAQVREDFFGPDKNEDDAARQQAIEELTKRLDKAEGVMERVLGDLSDIRAQLDALKAGG